jgi:indole-3-glycerol phosphate synthase
MLEKIISQKKNRLQNINQREKIKAWEKELEELPKAKDFRQALVKQAEVALIAEIKKASPSAGLFRAKMDVGKMASIYEQAGASCVSILTEEDFFLGSSDDLRLVRGASQLPVLRKDFIFTDYQIWESKMIGADCLLLIAAILPTAELKRFSSLAKELGLQTLVEVHTEEELDQALEAGSQIIGINNRNLNTMTVNLKITEKLILLVPDEMVTISESGISSRADILALQELGVDAALVGEAIIKSPDPGSKIKELLGQRIKTEVSG